MLASAQSRYLHALCLVIHFPCQRWLFNKGLLYWLKPINTWRCNLISSSLWLNVRSLDCLQWHIYRQHLHLLSAIIKAEHFFLLQFCGRKTTLIPLFGSKCYLYSLWGMDLIKAVDLPVTHFGIKWTQWCFSRVDLKYCVFSN